MKILHILDHSLPLHSGYTFRSRNIFNCQREAGLDPVVLTSPKHEESFGDAGTERELFEEVVYYRSGKTGKLYPVYDELRLVSRLRRKIIAVARQEKPDIIHAHSPVLNGLPAIRAGKILGLPVVYEIRAFWEDAAVDLGTCREGDLRYRATRALETHVCRKADAVVTICEGLKNDLKGRKNIDVEKVVIVGNAVDTANLLPSPPDDELAGQWGITGKDLVLGFVGSFYHYEGLDLLLEVMPRITEKFPMVKLLLVGGGPMEKKLRALAVTLGLTDQVIFTGRIPHQRVPGVYAMMDIMVFPRYSMRLTEIVTPLKPLEAMALQKVVLASNVGGHRELIRDGDTGLLFQAGNGDDLASRLVELIRSAGLRKSLVEPGACFVKRERTWRSNGEKYRELYRKILSEN